MSRVTVSQMPWGDCKVCFDFDGDLDRLWEAFWPMETAAHKLPDGWSLNETDGTGARLVVVFRVEGELRRKDGEVVARLLRSIATANALNSGDERAKLSKFPLESTVMQQEVENGL